MTRKFASLEMGGRVVETSAVAFANELYASTAAFYVANVEHFGDMGFAILYSPPLIAAEILFLGYQPGGGVEDGIRERLAGTEARWPEVNLYATAGWPLARALQKMLGLTALSKSAGMNAIFVRSPSISDYRKTVRSDHRKALERFCLKKVEGAVAVLRPKRIIAIGFETLALFGGNEAVLRNARGRVLVRKGTIAGRDAFATLHLSGARISNVDRDSIASFLMAQ